MFTYKKNFVRHVLYLCFTRLFWDYIPKPHLKCTNKIEYIIYVNVSNRCLLLNWKPTFKNSFFFKLFIHFSSLIVVYCWKPTFKKSFFFKLFIHFSLLKNDTHKEEKNCISASNRAGHFRNSCKTVCPGFWLQNSCPKTRHIPLHLLQLG